MTQSKKKDAPATWRHYNFTTAGPVDDYLYSMLPKRDEVLAEMEDYATENKIPIVGPAVARVLQQLALMINARNVFELGSAIGYSTIWWAQAVGENGHVVYTDGDSKNAERARGYFARAGVSKRVVVRTGDALEILSEEKQEFDIIFTATPSAIGTFTNPRSGGNTTVDPNNNVVESSEANNAAIANAVTVTAPDLTVSKSNDVSGSPCPLADGSSCAGSE